MWHPSGNNSFSGWSSSHRFHAAVNPVPRHYRADAGFEDWCPTRGGAIRRRTETIDASQPATGRCPRWRTAAAAAAAASSCMSLGDQQASWTKGELPSVTHHQRLNRIRLPNGSIKHCPSLPVRRLLATHRSTSRETAGSPSLYLCPGISCGSPAVPSSCGRGGYPAAPPPYWWSCCGTCWIWV